MERSTSTAVVAAAAAGGLLVGWLLGSRSRRGDVSSQTLLGATSERGDESRREGEVYVGIDLGGTTVRVGVVRYDGTLLAACEEYIGSSSRSPDAVLNLMCKVTGEALSQAKQSIKNVAGVGIGAPGLLDTERGIIKAIANFDWCDVHIAKRLGEKLSFPSTHIHLENDANAALLAELWVGVGRGKKNAVMVTLGTGVGGAILADGCIVRGASGDAGELGHMILFPHGRLHGKTGVRGIFEGYVSATGLVACTEERLSRESKNGTDTTSLSSLSLAAKDGNLTCKQVFAHAAQGDELAKQMVSETAELIGIGCINVCRCFDPEIVILTGGMTQAGSSLLDPIRASYVKHHWSIAPADSSRIVFASCGNDAGIVGCAAAALLRERGSLQ